MGDLISRSALLKVLKEDKESICSHVYAKVNTCDANQLEYELEYLITTQPIIETALVVHGKWEECGWVELDGHGGFITYPKEGMRCSNCNRAFKKVLLWTDNFCPNCGASMKKGE